MIQFERKGYFICDENTETSRKFIYIPDGSAASVKSKCAIEPERTEQKSEKKTEKTKAVKVVEVKVATASKMYVAKPYVEAFPMIAQEKISKMYSAPVYENLE